MVSCVTKCVSLLCLTIVACIGFVYFTGMYTFSVDENYVEIFVNSKESIFETDKRFLSLGLDSSFMNCTFHNLTNEEWDKLVELSSLLSPAYLRLGGTQADQILFSPSSNHSDRNFQHCLELSPDDYLIITGDDWIKINDFSQKSGLNLIFDLNVLLRSDSKWNTSNAQSLINFSAKQGFSLDFELGNEPNSFLHVFNVSISGQELAQDFDELKKILSKSKTYKESKLIGPDVTRPKNVQDFENPSLEFLSEFLSNTNSVDAVSWHQYYVNGRTATIKDFTNPDILDELLPQIHSVNNVVRKYSSIVPVWLGETSSAYGGGARGLSDRFVASFMWLDKLGIAAKNGISVVIRQSLFKNSYALIDSKFAPSSDFWISFFYKNLVGSKVLDVTFNSEHSNQTLRHLRFYSHCLSPSSPINGNIVLFGMNLSNKSELLIVNGINFEYPIQSFTFTADNFRLDSRDVLLNDNKLIYNRKTVYDVFKLSKNATIPLVIHRQSIVFFIFKNVRWSVCTQNSV